MWASSARRKAFSACTTPTPTAPSTLPQSTSALTRSATSYPALATQETGSSGRAEPMSTQAEAADGYARPSWDDYFMDITVQVAKRSTCGRLRVGAIIVKERRILTTGYNGSPAGLPHCD